MNVLLVIAVLLLIYALSWIFGIGVKGSSKVPLIGVDQGPLKLWIYAAKKQFALNAPALIDSAYHDFPTTNFRVQTFDNEHLIVAPKYLPELRMLPESKLNASRGLVEKHLGQFSGLDNILGSHTHIEVVRVPLTQNLDHFLPHMAKEIHEAMSKHFEAVTSEAGGSYPAHAFLYAMVLASSTRVFVGEPLCHDSELLEVIALYLSELFVVSGALRPFPEIFRPLLRPFVAPKRTMDKIVERGRKILDPVIEARRHSTEKHHDLLQYLINALPGDDGEQVVLKLLILNAAALQTSTMAAVEALYDMCARPAHIAAIREEARTVYRASGKTWTLSAVNKLKQLDAFMKESMRLSPPDIIAFNRVAMDTIHLSDGATIQAGTTISMPCRPMLRDPAYYTNPTTFDPTRFYDPTKAADVGRPPAHDFAGIEKGNVIFGNGRQTCPGRWYASAMIKLIFGTLLVEYDFGFPEGQITRPPSMCMNGTNIPSMTQEIYVRRLK